MKTVEELEELLLRKESSMELLRAEVARRDNQIRDAWLTIRELQDKVKESEGELK